MRARCAVWRTLACAATLAAAPIQAQEAATAPDSEPGSRVAAGAEARNRVTFDVVRLFGVEGRTLVEIYSRIPTSVLSFREASGSWEATLQFELAVRQGSEVVLQDTWKRTKTVADRRMLDSDRVFFVETHAFLLRPGTYELEGRIADESGRVVGELNRTLEAPRENPPASDLLLAARIVPDTASAAPEGYDPLRKNRLVLNPNPGGVYSTGRSPLVFFYYEFQNVEKQPLELVRVLRFLPSGSDRVVKEVRTEKTYQPGWTADFGAVNVAGLKGGSYELELTWEAAGQRELPPAYRGLSRRQAFVVVRESAPAAAPPAESPSAAREARPVVDYYEGYGVAQLDSVFDLLEGLFEAREKSLYRGLSPEGKREFLNRFWASRDPDPATPENDFHREVEERLAHVQKNFGSGTEEGHRTPRGRIYLKYGKPDRRVERVLESGFAAPYEIWIYYDTGYKYVFMDEFRNRRYILLTSSDPEEQGRPDWQELLPAEAVKEILRE